MSNEADSGADDAPRKKSKGMLFGAIGAVLLGGGAFYGVYSGMVPLPFGGEEQPAEAHAPESHGDGHDSAHPTPQTAGWQAPAYVPIEPMVISLGPDAAARHLRVSVMIEVAPGTETQVASIIPRINDVLNTYLRAVDERDIEIPQSMIRLRAQMLRRVMMVAPPDSVRDLLIQEFILN